MGWMLEDSKLKERSKKLISQLHKITKLCIVFYLCFEGNKVSFGKKIGGGRFLCDVILNGAEKKIVAYAVGFLIILHSGGQYVGLESWRYGFNSRKCMCLFAYYWHCWDVR